jgi:hypothetical protein
MGSQLRARRAFESLLVAALLTGCAAPPQTTALLGAAPPGLPQRALLDDVPFYPQGDHQCGPAALAMALGASGAPVDPRQLAAEVFVPDRRGSLAPELLAAARRHGRLAVTLPRTLEALLRIVGGGRPAIVLLNLSLPVFPVWHYAVVIGFDLPRGEVVLHSGGQAAVRWPLAVFERTWARAEHWAMVVAPPGDPPASLAIDPLVGAAAALERVDAGGAARTYATLTTRDPKAWSAWVGLGNAALAGGDLATALHALQQATVLRPDAPDAWNNLAVASLAAGRLPEARAAVARAIRLGGPRQSRYEQTRREIEAAGE